jgi:aryl-alcohol dehydrogenase-like predicted oxidoreductase
LKNRWMAEDKIGKVKKLAALAKQSGIPLPALSIAWCIKNPHVTTAILGATKKSQLIENLKALEVLPRLTDEVMTQIDDIVQTKPQLPEY